MTPPDSEQIARMNEVRAAYIKDVEKAERDLARVQARLEAARMKVSVADEIIAKLQNLPPTPSAVGAAFAGFGKYTGKSVSEAMLDVINTNAGVSGMAVSEIREILINEGLSNTKNLGVTIHVTAKRLAEKNLIRVEQTGAGKRFFRLLKSEEPQAAA
jgi:hypothetical protein